MAVQTGLMTAEELERMTRPEAHVDVLRGALVRMSPASRDLIAKEGSLQ